MNRVYPFLMLAILLTPALSADEPNKTKRTMEERLQQLEAHQQAQQAEIKQLKEQMLEARIEQKVAAEASKRLRLDVEFKKGFRMTSRDGDFQLKIGGRVQFDGLFRVDDDDALTSTFRNRRVRIYTAGHLYKYYYWKVQVEFSKGKGSLQDGYIELRHIDQARLKVGQIKEPFGFEENTSSKWVKLMERSMATNFIAPGHDLGLMLHGKLFDKTLAYGVGIFNGTGKNKTDENDDKDVAARITFKPFGNSENKWLKGLQFGGAVTYGQQAGSEAGNGPKTAVGTRVWRYAAGTTRDGDRTRFGAELAYLVGSFAISGEFLQSNEQLKLGGMQNNVRVQGWYVTLSYLLTGEQAKYGQITPLHPFDPHKSGGGLGAWELVARVGEINGRDLDRSFITGAERATQYMGGLNWYLNSMVKLSLNYQHATFGDSVGGTRSEDSLMFRLQLIY